MRKLLSMLLIAAIATSLLTGVSADSANLCCKDTPGMCKENPQIDSPLCFRLSFANENSLIHIQIRNANALRCNKCDYTKLADDYIEQNIDKYRDYIENYPELTGLTKEYFKESEENFRKRDVLRKDSCVGGDNCDCTWATLERKPNDPGFDMKCWIPQFLKRNDADEESAIKFLKRTKVSALSIECFSETHNIPNPKVDILWDEPGKNMDRLNGNSERKLFSLRCFLATPAEIMYFLGLDEQLKIEWYNDSMSGGPASNSPKYKMPDALNILKHLAKMEQLTPELVERYDFFGNGDIKIGNALEILKKLAGMESLAG